jgi:hypothetical protein
MDTRNSRKFKYQILQLNFTFFLQSTPIPRNYLPTQFCEIFKIQTKKYHLSLKLIKNKTNDKTNL